MKIKCPKCRRPLKVRGKLSSKLLGKKLDCPICKHSFILQKASARSVVVPTQPEPGVRTEPTNWLMRMVVCIALIASLAGAAVVVWLILDSSNGSGKNDIADAQTHAMTPSTEESTETSNGKGSSSKSANTDPKIMGESSDFPINAIGNKWALLIGVNSYDHADQLNRLEYTDDDIHEFANALREIGFQNIIEMTHKAAADIQDYRPTAMNIRAAVKTIQENAGPQDTILIAFSGHGVQFEGEAENYFCPIDADLQPKLDKDRTSLISLSKLYGQLADCKVKHKILIADACRNDPIRSAKGGGKVIRVESVGKRKRPILPSGIAAFFSCSATEQSYEYKEYHHSLFFHHLIEGLRGKGDVDKDGSVYFGELANFVIGEVEKSSKKFKLKKQTPERTVNVEGRILMGIVKHREKRQEIVVSSQPPRNPEAIGRNDMAMLLAHAIKEIQHQTKVEEERKKQGLISIAKDKRLQKQQEKEQQAQKEREDKRIADRQILFKNKAEELNRLVNVIDQYKKAIRENEKKSQGLGVYISAIQAKDNLLRLNIEKEKYAAEWNQSKSGSLGWLANLKALRITFRNAGKEKYSEGTLRYHTAIAKADPKVDRLGDLESTGHKIQRWIVQVKEKSSGRLRSNLVSSEKQMRKLIGGINEFKTEFSSIDTSMRSAKKAWRDAKKNDKNKVKWNNENIEYAEGITRLEREASVLRASLKSAQHNRKDPVKGLLGNAGGQSSTIPIAK